MRLSPTRQAVLLLAAAIPFAGSAARAEYQDPFQCQPPMGQGLFEIGARNMAMRYRQEPTPANKATMCNSYRKAVNAFANAVEACRRSTCTTEDYREICANRRQKLGEWRERPRTACAGRR